jgi:hypothetical protein
MTRLGLSRRGQHYNLDTLFTSAVQEFPQLSPTEIQQLAFSLLYHQARGESLQGVGFQYNVPVVVTDQAAYLLWPHGEEARPLAEAPELSSFEL